MTKKLYKNCLKYPAWKAKHNPNFKPWLFPEQINCNRINLAKCKPRQYVVETVDESNIAINDFATVENGEEKIEDGDISDRN